MNYIDVNFANYYVSELCLIRFLYDVMKNPINI